MCSRLNRSAAGCSAPLAHALKAASGVGPLLGKLTVIVHFRADMVELFIMRQRPPLCLRSKKPAFLFGIINDVGAGSESDEAGDKPSFIPVFWIHLHLFRCSAAPGVAFQAERPFSLDEGHFAGLPRKRKINLPVATSCKKLLKYTGSASFPVKCCDLRTLVYCYTPLGQTVQVDETGHPSAGPFVIICRLFCGTRGGHTAVLGEGYRRTFCDVPLNALEIE